MHFLFFKWLKKNERDLKYTSGLIFRGNIGTFSTSKIYAYEQIFFDNHFILYIFCRT